jgi:hypothetical protein
MEKKERERKKGKGETRTAGKQSTYRPRHRWGIIVQWVLLCLFEVLEWAQLAHNQLVSYWEQKAGRLSRGTELHGVRCLHDSSIITLRHFPLGVRKNLKTQTLWSES